MSIKTMPFYTVVCDWPGCDRSADEGGEYAAWASASGALDSARDADWWEVRDGKHEIHYCDEHPCAWASDHEDGEPFPDHPFLLIHDGDTDNSEDDGKVTLKGVDDLHDLR